ncbi:hypothetical protein F2Q69_00052415 [Brassica cretica]|uniref:DUF4283 domain-containing protein n=1 Tax=Brassica cretica TaxID=69181 RepID=A0A8S9N0L6_BRACR|nr:hypothetical protein F2Q69_00052415 [Brassica cretica]
MPSQWGMQDRITANDLGNGRFLFNFTSEDDLNLVLSKGPFHYKYCMFVLVRWEPVIHDDYPWTIPFWVVLSGIPLHLWNLNNLKSIGGRLGHIDLDSIQVAEGRMLINIDSRLPPKFSMKVQAPEGEEEGEGEGWCTGGRYSQQQWNGRTRSRGKEVPTVEQREDMRSNSASHNSTDADALIVQQRRKIASTIVTTSRVLVPSTENITYRSQELALELSFLPNTSVVNEDAIVIEALSDMDITGGQEDGRLESAVQDEDLLGLDLMEYEAVKNQTQVGVSSHGKQKSKKSGSKRSAPLGIHNKKIQFIRRGSPSAHSDRHGRTGTECGALNASSNGYMNSHLYGSIEQDCSMSYNNVCVEWTNMDHNHIYSAPAYNFFDRPKPMYELEVHEEEGDYGGNAYLEHRRTLPLFPMHGEDHINGGGGVIWKHGQSDGRDRYGRGPCASLKLCLNSYAAGVTQD